MNTLTDHQGHDSRSLPRRRVYLGEGLTFEIECRDAWLQGEAIDLTHEGLGVAVVLATDVMMPAVGEVVSVRYTGRGGSGARQQAVVRYVGSLQTGRGVAPAARAVAHPRDDQGRRRRSPPGRAVPESRRRCRRSPPPRARGSSARRCTSASSRSARAG